MKTVFYVLILIFIGNKIQAQTAGMLLNKEFVDLKGKEGKIIFINSTPDTLKLGYMFFNWLPYVETRDSIKIAPGQQSSITLQYNFPDFIRINNQFMVYNGPGGKLICNINDYKSKIIKASFQGSFAQENQYYLNYQQFLGNYDQERRPYYEISEQLKDWNTFPAKGDSITEIRLKFLEQYNQPIPKWFKLHERRRLLYNNYSCLSNALLSKEAHSGQKINVKANYYDFEQLLNKDNDMVLNETYLYCMSDYSVHLAKLSKLSGISSLVDVIDKQYHQTDIGDVNLMRRLGLLYRTDKLSYDSLIQNLKFKQPLRKIWLDSLIQTKLGTPYIGKKAPAMALIDNQGKAISLTDYLGQMVIVNFWAVWCGPCKAEFTYENKLYQQYKNKGLTVINVCFDSDRELWERDSKKYNLQMVNLFTNKADYNKLLRQYNLSAPPRSILINKKGIVTDNYLKRASFLTATDINNLLSDKFNLF